MPVGGSEAVGTTGRSREAGWDGSRLVLAPDDLGDAARIDLDSEGVKVQSGGLLA
ncbi:hypothetical protein ACFQPA_11395 [Halomarina halobia]|uniref:Uncharacterized protein n=1 Tax=Halomarina halobia TaxID=3033386 RepID=A0ABD6AAD7_9EURY|nr:hypothetical protein [Halomarina sp. PSR21]